MNIIRSFKISIAVFSSIMFIYQTSEAVNKLIHPPVVDTTTTLNIADVDLLVTVCPLDQWNESKINELGYRTPGEMMSGMILTTEKFVGWGEHLNLTFDDLVLKTQNFNLSNPLIEMVHPDLTTIIKIAHEENFYPQFGWCYDLVNFTTSGEVKLRFHMGSKDNRVSQYKVFITDKRLRTRTTLHTKSLWGSIEVRRYKDTNYVIKVDQLSYFDPRNPDACKTFTSDGFDKCVDKELKKVWKPLINCNPPWVTSEDKCKGKLNVTTDNEKMIIKQTLETASGLIQMTNFPAKRKCFKPCTVAQSMVFSNGRGKDSALYAFLTLDFADEVAYTTKELAYGPSEFLIDMGSSLGLWFGLSVFGITDLGIMAAQSVEDTRRKYMK